MDGIHLEIGDRAFTVVTGPVGSGKSALLRAIAGLAELSGGEIALGGKPLAGTKPAARDVAMVFSEPALYPHASVRENIALGLKVRKFSETEVKRRVEDAATTLGVEGLLELRPAALSAAQAQRVSIARAIARQPKVLLLDEPLAHLDAMPRAQLRAELRQLHERLQITFIHATRDPAEALALGQDVVVMQEGKVLQHGPLAMAYEKPADLFTAGFLGWPPMNFIRGVLKRERDFLLFNEEGDGTIQLRLPPASFALAEEWFGKPLLLGIRPEDVQIVETAKGSAEAAAAFPALVDFAETVGADAELHLQTGAHALVARRRASSESARIGRRVQFSFDPERVHFFDPATRQRLAGT